MDGITYDMNLQMGDLTIGSTFQYFKSDPFAVTVVFMDVKNTTWIFARQLLIDGIVSQTGEGDIRIHPEGDVVIIDLSPDGGFVSLTADKETIQDFLEKSYLVVIPGQEEIDMEQFWDE